MKLSQYIKENPDATYLDAVSFNYIVESLLEKSIVHSLLTEHDSVLILKEKAEEDTKAAGLMLAINSGVSDYNLMNSNELGVKQQALLAYLETIGAVTSAFKDAAISESNKKITPFSEIEESDFSAAKTAFTDLTIIDKVWDNKQRYLKVTLHEDLYEPTNVVLFYTDDIFTNENLGRPKRLHKAGEYIIDLTSIVKVGTLHVNFNINANADCELI